MLGLAAFREDILHFVYAHRATFRIAAIGSWLGLEILSLLIDGGRAPGPLWYLGRAAAFFLAALITRFSFLHVESRLQIVAFCALAAVLEAARPFMSGGRPAAGVWAAGAIGACAGVLLAKRIIEPGAISISVMRVLGIL